MSFISVSYLLFLILAAAFYYRLPVKFKTVWLLCASWFFYLTWQPAFLVVLIYVTLISYSAGRKIASAADQKLKKRRLAASVILLFLPLLFFKYYNFLNESLASLFYPAAVDYSIPFYSFLIPLGISFFTFEAVSYVADVYRGYLAPEKKLKITPFTFRFSRRF